MVSITAVASKPPLSQSPEVVRVMEVFAAEVIIAVVFATGNFAIEVFVAPTVIVSEDFCLFEVDRVEAVFDMVFDIRV